ncbi:LysR family transcriptional regulator [Limnohabitans sp.]|uniref:LysR family transcriptional regulator n=1 Tax=Limnohabitans sp. TaxID=1907725 RepID=UPI0035B12D8D
MTSSNLIQAADLGFFVSLVNAGSLSGAAREQGISSAAVSRHLSLMESRLGFALLNRTTRRMSLTPEGEVYLDYARRIHDDIEELADRLMGSKFAPQGLLRVNATLGFGRSHIAPIISEFCSLYPKVDLQLQLSVNPPPSTDDAYDVCFRFGNPPDSRSIAKFIAPNRRLLVAAPGYLKKHGIPQTPAELKQHNCIGIRQGDEAYGVWRFQSVKGKSRSQAGEVVSVKVRGNLTTNDGGIAVNWALDGHGILLRAEWDIRKYLDSGQLVPVLGSYRSPDADIYAVYAERHRTSLRVKTLVEFVAAKFKAT